MVSPAAMDMPPLCKGRRLGRKAEAEGLLLPSGKAVLRLGRFASIMALSD